MKKLTSVVALSLCALSTTASAELAVAPGESAAAPAPVDFFDPPGPEKTKFPKREEWSSATPVHVARRVPSGCKVERLREFLRIHCAMTNATTSLLAGSPEGTMVWGGTESAELIFPLRRGDRRVFQLESQDGFAEGRGPYGSPGIISASPTLIVQEQWLDGEAQPIVIIE
jgi:hypothetical protein